MSDGIRITGNWDFDNNKKIDPKDYDASKISSKNTELYKKGKVDLSDGISRDEAEYIITEFEKEGLVDFDDFDINDADIRSFMKTQGYGEVTNEQVQDMKSVVNSIANTYMEANNTANVAEDYTGVQDIYLRNTGNSNINTAVKPSNIKNNTPGEPVTQQVVKSGSNAGGDPTKGTTLAELIKNAYPLDTIAKNAGMTNSELLMHNAIDEYIQSNPRLAILISEANGGVDLKDLSYDQIANTDLFAASSSGGFEIVAPQFNMPVNLASNAGVQNGVSVAQEKYSPKDSKVNIDLLIHEGVNANSPNPEYATVADAIADQYGLDKNDPNYESTLRDIAFQIANDPRNASRFIEGNDKNLNDNTRVDVLLNHKNMQDLFLPDNVVINNIASGNAGSNAVYTKGDYTYQLSPLSPVDGQATGGVNLPATTDGKPTAGSIENLEDVLKYSADPRTGEALMKLDENGNEVQNIHDEVSQNVATAYMMNSIKDNPEIFAATQEINGSLQLFGAYDIKDEAVLGKMNELLSAAKAEGLSNEDAAAKARAELINQFGDIDGDGTGKLEDFLEKYGNINLDNAKSIKFYDENGNIRFKNDDGTPVKYNMSSTYVRFGTVGDGGSGVTNNSTKDPFTPTPSTSGTPSTTPSTGGTPSSTPSTGGTPSTTPSTTTSMAPSTTPSTGGTPSSTPSTGGKPSSTPSTGGTTPSTGGKPSTTPSTGGTTKPSTTPSTGGTTKPSSTPSTGGTTKPSTTPSTGGTTKPSSTPSTGGTTKPSSTPSTGATHSSTPSTGGTPSSTPSTGGTTPSTGGTQSTTPSSAASETPKPSDSPIFNPPTSITEPTESKDPVIIPSKPDEGGSSSSQPGEDCPPPPPPSNATNGTSNVTVNQTPVSSETAATTTNTADKAPAANTPQTNTATVQKDNTINTNPPTSVEQPAESSAPANPTPPPSSNAGGGTNTTVVGGNEAKPAGTTVNKVDDTTSGAIKKDEYVEKRENAE